MAVWLVRAGSSGQFEQKFLTENRIYATWDSLNFSLAGLTDRAHLAKSLQSIYSEEKIKTVINWTGQLWPFANDMKLGDIIILPLKTQRAIQIGEVTSDYHYDAESPAPYGHWRSVKWIADAVPREHFGKDLLNSFGAFLTICRIKRNNAEARLAKMRANEWKPERVSSITAAIPVATDEEIDNVDVEETANDEIVKLLKARFKGHGLTRLVDAILKAQGYTTYVSPEGPDGGVDILAGMGKMGFNRPRLCVEVKTEDVPIDRPTVDKLLGAVSKFQADEALFVSLSGFKPNVARELARNYFRLRLWSLPELLSQLFLHYEHFDEKLRAELPLKRIWAVAAPDGE